VPVFALTDELRFPHPSLAAEGGLLAVGGDLRPERLILAYSHGIFPWYSEGRPILWWCPSPRLVLEPASLHVSRSLRKALRREPYRITMDVAFEQVIDACARVPRPDQDGTWITRDMRAAFVRLHELGIAHSVEAWQDDELAGGLYGLSLGTAFFGESMFARMPDASKLAFVALVRQLERWDFDLVDCQVVTEHLVRFGAEELELDAFLDRLDRAVSRPTRPGPWRFDDAP
jgi:leucyl/phenylalanyl-tRNA--protein transferase